MRKPIPAELRLALRYLPAAFHAALADDSAAVFALDLGDQVRALYIPVTRDSDGQPIAAFAISDAILRGDQTVRDALGDLVGRWLDGALDRYTGRYADAEESPALLPAAA